MQTLHLLKNLRRVRAVLTAINLKENNLKKLNTPALIDFSLSEWVDGSLQSDLFLYSIFRLYSEHIQIVVI